MRTEEPSTGGIEIETLFPNSLLANLERDRIKTITPGCVICDFKDFSDSVVKSAVYSAQPDYAIGDFKGRTDPVSGLNAFDVAHSDVLSRLAGTAEKHCREKKNHDHDRTGDDGFRSHGESIAG